MTEPSLKITGKPIEFGPNDNLVFKFKLKAAEYEALTDGVRSTDPKTGVIEERFVAILASDIRIGSLARIQCGEPLQAEGSTREVAKKNLEALVSEFVTAAYARLKAASDEDSQAIAFAMIERVDMSVG